MSQNEAHARLVWGIGIYLCAAYVFLGLLSFFAWQRSDNFGLIGWNWNFPNAGIFQKVVYAISAGGLGATTYSFWNLFEHYCRAKDFDPTWSIWYIFGPISGSLLGIATYAVIIGGLLVLGGSITLQNNWALFALCYLAGFASKRVLWKLNSIAEDIFQKGEQRTANPQNPPKENDRN